MTTITAKSTIKTSKKRVWEAIADLGGVVNFNPYVANVYYSSDHQLGAGASRICEFGPGFGGLTIEETVIEWCEEESIILDIDFIKGFRPPLRDMRATIHIREDEGDTQVSFEMEYEPRLGILGRLFDRLVGYPRYQSMVSSVISGLKHYAETDQVVDLGTLQQIQMLMAPA